MQAVLDSLLGSIDAPGAVVAAWVAIGVAGGLLLGGLAARLLQRAQVLHDAEAGHVETPGEVARGPRLRMQQIQNLPPRRVGQ